MNRRLALLTLVVGLGTAPGWGMQNPGGQQPTPSPPAPSSPAQPVPSAPAQQPAPPAAAEPEQGVPLNKLGLSDEQKKEIHTIRQQAQQQVQTVRNNTSLTPHEQTQQIRQIRHKAAQQVDGVLTPEQRGKYDAWRKAHQRHHHPAHGHPA